MNIRVELGRSRPKVPLFVVVSIAGNKKGHGQLRSSSCEGEFDSGRGSAPEQVLKMDSSYESGR
jgi:hypothetical protein